MDPLGSRSSSWLGIPVPGGCLGSSCTGGHTGNEHLFLFQLRQVSDDRSQCSRGFPPAAGRVRATTADSIAFNRLVTSGSSSAARLQSSALWVALRQRSHRSDFLALSVKQIVYREGPGPWWPFSPRQPRNPRYAEGGIRAQRGEKGHPGEHPAPPHRYPGNPTGNQDGVATRPSTSQRDNAVGGIVPVLLWVSAIRGDCLSN